MAQPAKEHAVLKQDAGTWHAAGKMFMPGSDQGTEFEGTETNEMIGEFWLVSNFKGDFGGMEFRGHSYSGFNPDTGKYESTWIDSMSPYAMTMTGEYDAASKTMKSTSVGKDGQGNEMKGKSEIVYKDEDTRVFTMWGADPASGEMQKMMEIVYTRQK
jgi:hypothetical protein